MLEAVTPGRAGGGLFPDFGEDLVDVRKGVADGEVEEGDWLFILETELESVVKHE